MEVVKVDRMVVSGQGSTGRVLEMLLPHPSLGGVGNASRGAIAIGLDRVSSPPSSEERCARWRLDLVLPRHRDLIAMLVGAAMCSKGWMLVIEAMLTLGLLLIVLDSIFQIVLWIVSTGWKNDTLKVMRLRGLWHFQHLQIRISRANCLLWLQQSLSASILLMLFSPPDRAHRCC